MVRRRRKSVVTILCSRITIRVEYFLRKYWINGSGRGWKKFRWDTAWPNNGILSCKPLFCVLYNQRTRASTGIYNINAHLRALKYWNSRVNCSIISCLVHCRQTSFRKKVEDTYVDVVLKIIKFKIYTTHGIYLFIIFVVDLTYIWDTNKAAKMWDTITENYNTILTEYSGKSFSNKFYIIY